MLPSEFELTQFNWEKLSCSPAYRMLCISLTSVGLHWHFYWSTLVFTGIHPLKSPLQQVGQNGYWLPKKFGIKNRSKLHTIYVEIVGRINWNFRIEPFWIRISDGHPAAINYHFLWASFCQETEREGEDLRGICKKSVQEECTRRVYKGASVNLRQSQSHTLLGVASASFKRSSFSLQNLLGLEKASRTSTGTCSP